MLKVRVLSYGNPTGGCYSYSGACCDDSAIQLPDCSGSQKCDSYFYYCLRPLTSDNVLDVWDGCFYRGSRISLSNRDDSVTDFTQSTMVLGLENPLMLEGLTNDYRVSYRLRL